MKKLFENPGPWAVAVCTFWIISPSMIHDIIIMNSVKNAVAFFRNATCNVDGRCGADEGLKV
jgi:hypothetical protein